MRQKIKVRFLPTGKSKEVSFEEAKRILEETYSDPSGGLIFNGKTNRVIYRIDSDVEEMTVLESIISGG